MPSELLLWQGFAFLCRSMWAKPVIHWDSHFKRIGFFPIRSGETSL